MAFVMLFFHLYISLKIHSPFVFKAEKDVKQNSSVLQKSILPSRSASLTFSHSIILWNLSKGVNRSICCVAVYDTVQGFLTYLQEGRGAQQGEAWPEGQEGGRRAPGQHIRWGLHCRERAEDVWMLNTVNGRKERDWVSCRCNHNEFHSWNPLLCRWEISLRDFSDFAKGWTLNSAEN